MTGTVLQWLTITKTIIYSVHFMSENSHQDDQSVETPSSMAEILKKALATKNAQHTAVKNNANGLKKDYSIGMPPRGTRRAMGKR